MKRSLLFYVLLTFLGLNISAQDTFPPYSEVVKKFFSEYSVDVRPKKVDLLQEIVFHKKPDGWHVVIKDVYDQKDPILYDGTFWSSSSKEYKSLSLRKTEQAEKDGEFSSLYLSQYDHKYYRICPYFGYKGWDKDVITLFGKFTDLDDSTTYAVGRAYSSYASNFLHDNLGFQLKDESFKIENVEDTLTSEQLATYRLYRHKAIELFHQVVKINPDYKTIVGSIYTKMWNEYLTSFLDIRQYKNEEEAVKEIQEDLYDANLIAVAKNYLSSCKKNAILLTYGDNDTYPLLYVQSKFNFRQDVLVVNTSLLNTGRYINYLRGPVLKAKPLPLSLSNQVFENDKFSYVILDTLLSTFKPIRLVIKEIPEDANPSNWYSVRLSTNKFFFPTDKDTVFIKVDEQFILRSTIVLFDILGQSRLDRPIHLSSSMASSNYSYYADYLYQTGLIYEFRKKRKSNVDDVVGQIDVKAMYANLTTNYEWGDLPKSSKTGKVFISSYRFYFNQLSEIYIKQNKLDTAKTLLNKSLQLMPDKTVPFNGYNLKTAKLFYDVGDKKMATSIFKRVNKNFKNKVTSYDPIKYIDYAISRADEKEDKKFISFLKKTKKKL